MNPQQGQRVIPGDKLARHAIGDLELPAKVTKEIHPTVRK